MTRIRGGVISRRQALSMAGIFVVTASCNPEKLFGPCTGTPPEPDQVLPPGRDVFIRSDLDAQLSTLPHDENIALHLTGSLQTKGCYRWGQYATRNLGKNWTVDGDAEISLEPTEVDSQPLYCLAGPARSVSGITTRGNHSALAPNWSGSLRTGGVLLEGDGSIDRVTFKDFGSLGAETFVAVAAVITNSRATDFFPGASDTQVTVWFTGDKRAFALHEGNEILASSGVWVQGHTIYDAMVGVVRGNRTVGARTGYYGDYWVSKNRVIEGNRFIGCEHGIQLQLSPTPEEIAWNFSHEDYEIGWNEIESSLANVSLNTYGPSTDTRFIRNIRIHPSLSLENSGATDVRREAVCERRAA